MHTAPRICIWGVPAKVQHASECGGMGKLMLPQILLFLVIGGMICFDQTFDQQPLESKPKRANVVCFLCDLFVQQHT